MGANKEEFTNLRHYLEQHYNWFGDGTMPKVLMGTIVCFVVMLRLTPINL